MAILGEFAMAKALIRVAKALEAQNRLIMAANHLTKDALETPAEPDWPLEPSVTVSDDEEEWIREQRAARATELGENFEG